MAHLIFSVNGREIGRRKLDGTVVVGRSPECDVCVHDILLSRKHCQFEKCAGEWVVIDLASKNGTFLRGKTIERSILANGDAVLIGKTTIAFAGQPVPRTARGGAALKIPNNPRPRPADPWATMEATVSGFDYIKAKEEQGTVRLGSKPRMEEIAPMFRGVRLPTPQPSPREPRAYESEDLYSMLNELVSSSWDSIYMNASRPAPTRPMPRPIVAHSADARHPRDRRRSAADLALQVTQGLLTPPPSARKQRPTRHSRWQRALVGVARGLATMGRVVMILGVVHLLSR